MKNKELYKGIALMLTSAVTACTGQLLWKLAARSDPILLVIAGLAIYGCGGCDCETPKCASENDGVATMSVVSVPGCGGCSNSGCGSACWARSCRLVRGSWEDVNPESKLLACDIRYMGGECGGCLQTEQSFYFGKMDLTDGENSASGCFRGSSEKGTEDLRDGSGCVTTPYYNSIGWQTINVVETETGVE